MLGKKSPDSATGSYKSNHIYDKPLYSRIEVKSMEYEGVARNPVIVIHGFLGSRLMNIETGKNVWGDFKGIDALLGFSDHQLHALSHPMKYGEPLNQLKDNIVPVDLLTTFNIRILGIHFQMTAYDKIIDILKRAGYTQENKPLPEDKNFYSLFTFQYDWRRDLPENAIRLHKFILQKKEYLQEKYKELYGIENYNVQFDILAHSMGGLLARYYLRYGNQDLPEDGTLPNLDWSGSNNVDRAILIGTPNAGYLDTCMELINGLQIASHAPVYPPAVLCTFPSYYQMMPPTETKSIIYRREKTPVDVFNPQTWIKMKWGFFNNTQKKILNTLLPDVTEDEQYNIAYDHISKCLKRAKQFIEAMKIHSSPPDNTTFILFLGNAVKTSRQAEVDLKTGRIEITGFESGDGKVLASSALMDEREGNGWQPFFVSPIKWQTVVHLEAAHMGIMESSEFENNILYYLLLAPTNNNKN